MEREMVLQLAPRNINPFSLARRITCSQIGIHMLPRTQRQKKSSLHHSLREARTRTIICTDSPELRSQLSDDHKHISALKSVD